MEGSMLDSSSLPLPERFLSEVRCNAFHFNAKCTVNEDKISAIQMGEEKKRKSKKSKFQEVTAVDETCKQMNPASFGLKNALF